MVSEVLATSSALRRRQKELGDVVAALDADQRRVSEASDEARLLSEKAFQQLGDGGQQIRSSLEQVAELFELIDVMTEHVTGFAAAMNQVRTSSEEIGQIADTTSILALNATIEAARAGGAGTTFANVAEEVKQLAAKTRAATDEITRTMEALSVEGQGMIVRIEEGAAESDRTRGSVTEIEATIGGVTQLVERVDQRNDAVTRSSATISGHVGDAQAVLARLDDAVAGNEEVLEDSNNRLTELQVRSSDTLDALAHAGLAPEDAGHGAYAAQVAAQLQETTEAALRDGTLSLDALFDSDYQRIEGSNPPRFSTRLSAWANAHWRPMFDRATKARKGVDFVVANDRSGWLPAHISYLSREPTGDLAHDATYCHAGTKLSEQARHSLLSGEPGEWQIRSYSVAAGAGKHLTMLSAAAPLFFAGQRWGSLAVGYGFRKLR